MQHITQTLLNETHHNGIIRNSRLMTEYTMTKTQNTFLFDRPKTDKYFYYTQLADVRFHSKKTAE